MLAKLLIFLVLFYGLTYKLNYKKLETKLKCGRFAGAFLSSITIFSPQITFDNNAMFVVFFPIFFFIGFIFGFLYWAVNPYKEIFHEEIKVEERAEDTFVIEKEHFVLAKEAAIGIAVFILIGVAIVLIIFKQPN